ncbi:MAG: hypothetical protein ACD_66C00141G0001, partial [uncultured bacterium]
LYRVGDIEKSEVSRIDVEQYKPYKAKKRYVIGKGLPDDLKEAWHGYTKITAHTSDETEFLIPKGPNRFHLVGGAKFIHGGAFLQEICIPVIQCKRIREDGQSPVKARKVEINVLTGNNVVKEPRYKITLLQTELLSEKILPRKVKVFFGDKDKNKITNEVSLTFDAETNNDPSCKQVAEFTFSNFATQQSKDFYLWVLDASDDRHVIQPMNYTISIYFQDEFGD